MACDPRGCERFFDKRFAGYLARRYRKRGLDPTARRMVEFLEQRDVRGATVLEIGGGLGEIQVELLRRGAARVTNLELSAGYEAEADALLASTGLADRAERRLHDIAVDPAGVPPADIVVLHRVVCCYPDYRRLLAAAADHARRLLVFSYPPYRAGRVAFAAENLFFRMRRIDFRVYGHPPRGMLAVLGDHGLRRTYAHRGLVWRVAGLERA